MAGATGERTRGEGEASRNEKPRFFLTLALAALGLDSSAVSGLGFGLRFDRLFIFEACLVETRQQPLAKDVSLFSLARPARAVEHRQSHRQRMMLTGAILRQLK